ncbi:MAG: tRNA lysidine(34) synthetase TilS [Syntrophobacteraceae bacterium]|nr:tRNA lysidine(34) synthetase TilS [Syntrophobacteraceae bacterium]
MNPAATSLPALALEYIRRHGLISAGDHILAAVSGGPDSVALLGVLSGLKDCLAIERITVLHFDHRLRGKESDEDREFVRALAHSAGFDFRLADADVSGFAQKKKISVEMAARECRRSFFLKTAANLNGAKIALGHTADDQAEEVLLRILRGTGPAGIQAMSPATDAGIIRPLLFADRTSILEYLQGRGMEYRVDSTNFDPSCQRNFLRLKVFPLLKEAFNPQIVRTITRCADLAREEESWLRPHIQDLWNDLCLKRGKRWCALDFERLRGLHPALLRRILRLAISTVKGNLSGVGFVHLKPLIEMVYSGKRGKSVEIPGGVEATAVGRRLVIGVNPCAGPNEPPTEPLVVNTPGSYRFGGFSFELRLEDKMARDRDGGSVRMDMEKLRWPLAFRFRRPGDRFRPLGMRGAKKLQDFFTDSRVPRFERPEIPLLCDSEKICWVAGMRMDDRVKVDSDTSRVLMVKFVRFSGDGVDPSGSISALDFHPGD